MEIVGVCDITQRNIEVSEKHYIVNPPFGIHTQLQFKDDISYKIIDEFCKSIYRDIPYKIESTVNHKPIVYGELMGFIQKLHQLHEKYDFIYQLPIVLKKIVNVVSKNNLTGEEKGFIEDVEDAGLLYKTGTSERKSLYPYKVRNRKRLLAIGFSLVLCKFLE